jgi:hypothetical protein
MKVVIFIVFAVTLESSILWSQSAFRPRIPKTWDEAALADWATPIAGLNVRPTHISAKEYYSLAVENRRTFPVYYPGREPEAYWEMLQHIAPKPLIEPEQLISEADWIEAGRRVFYEADNLHLRTLDPRVITAARSRETFEKVHAQPLADGTVFGLRWVPTKDGVALSLSNCAGCHLLYLPDNTPVAGAPALADMARGRDSVHLIPLIGALHTANRVVTGATPFFMGPESLGAWLYQAYGVPWRKDDIHEQLKAVTPAQYSELVVAATLGGGARRPALATYTKANRSPFRSA